MRIGLVSQWFYPEGVRIAGTWATELAKLGHEVHVVTGFPNYPSGRLYNGYTISLYSKEQWNGVTIHRGPLYPSHDGNPIKRFVNYFSFAIGSTLASFRVPQVDVWITNCTPVTAANAAMVQKLLRGTPCVTVIQDLWPDSVLESNFLPPSLAALISPPLNAYCRLTYRLSDVIGVIAPGMAQLLEERGVPSRKIQHMPNGLPDMFSTAAQNSTKSSRAELGLPEGRLFMYAGNMGPLQNLEALVEAFAKVPSAQLAIIGSGVTENRIRRKVEDVANIHVLGRVPSTEIGRYISASDIQIVSLADSPLLRVTMPSKVQTALSAGKPIFAYAAGDIAEVVTRPRAGLACAPGNEEAAVRTIEHLNSLDESTLIEMGARAREVYDTEYSVRKMVGRLELALNSAIQSRLK